MRGPLTWLSRRRAAKRAAAAQNITLLRQRALARPNCRVLYVRKVYQHARRGTKALVELDGAPGTAYDAWFWWSRVQPGQLVSAEVSPGWGPHNAHNILYIGHEKPRRSGTFEVIAPKIVAAAMRYHDHDLRG